MKTINGHNIILDEYDIFLENYFFLILEET